MTEQPDEISSKSAPLPSKGPLQFLHEIHSIRAALLIIAAGVSIAILHFASTILIPIVLAVFLSYVLNPFVAVLMRVRVPGTQLGLPRSLAALLVVIMMVGLSVVLGIFITDQVRRLAADLPHYEDRISANVSDFRDNLMTIQNRVENLLQPIRRYPDDDELNGGTNASDNTELAPPALESPAERVQVFLDQGNDFWVSAGSYIAGGITGILGFMAQALMCIFVLVFILAQAPAFRIKIVNILGHNEAQKRLIINILQNVNEDIQRYLFNRFATNFVVAILVGVFLYLYGLNYAFLIGILAGIFNFVPYVGPIIGTFFPALIAYMQFGDLQSIIWPVMIYASVTGLEGNLVTPIILGRHLKLNSLIVLLSAIFWGWLWGPIGLLLAIPIAAAIKVVAENVDTWRPIRELLRG